MKDPFSPVLASSLWDSGVLPPCLGGGWLDSAAPHPPAGHKHTSLGRRAHPPASTNRRRNNQLPCVTSAVVTWYMKPWCLPGETMTDMYYPIHAEGLYNSLMQVRMGLGFGRALVSLLHGVERVRQSSQCVALFGRASGPASPPPWAGAPQRPARPRRPLLAPPHPFPSRPASFCTARLTACRTAPPLSVPLPVPPPGGAVRHANLHNGDRHRGPLRRQPRLHDRPVHAGGGWGRHY